MSMQRRDAITRIALAGAMLPALPLRAAPASWPQRPVRLQVVYPPGGLSDATARTLADLLAPLLGVPVLVEHRPGAGGSLGLDALAQVDVGVRKHRHQDGQALGRMAAAIYRTAQLRLSRGHLVRPVITQFERDGDHFTPRSHAVDTEERPPMREITEYASRHAA